MVTHPRRELFVEGGGDSDSLKTECRRGFQRFLEKAEFSGRMPKIIACGGRESAYDMYRTAISRAGADDVILLLVDSEAPVSDPAGSADPWRHVGDRQRDGWAKPDGVGKDGLQLMVECMESWFLADVDALLGFFGQGFRRNAFSGNPNPESISKADVANVLEKATRDTKTKGSYRKGGHSFKILGLIDPDKVRKCCPYADRLLTHLANVL